MVFDISIALAWLLFLALFPMAFIWLRRAWRIIIKKDYSEVALKRGEAPPNVEKWAPFTGILNLVAGCLALATIIGVALALLPYKTWYSMAGMTLWGKLIGDFIISRQAHPFTTRKKNNESA